MVKVPKRKLTEAMKKQIIADSDRYKPKNEDEPANGNILWQINRMGLISDALSQSTVEGVVTKIAAWQIMREAALDGVDFGAK
jgi:hypothetical protein